MDPRLHERPAFWLGIAIAVLAIVFLAAYWKSAEGQSKKPSYDDVPIEKDEAHILALDREALDKAYKDHIGLVFGVWMKDPNDLDAPRRAGQGARNARKGYSISRDRIEEREQKLKESKQ